MKHPIRLFLTLVSILGLGLLVLMAIPAQANPVEGGPTWNGHDVQVDLPPALRSKNIGGSDGAGLCVFTSIQHASIYQNVEALKSFQKWMSHHPGGGWPEKVDKMIAQFCKEQNLPIPLYVQYEGKDPTILETALQSGRYPCVTYDGYDCHYRGQIAHMVNLVYLDSQYAAIMDNNFIKDSETVWMTRQEFLQRWTGGGGGWAVVFCLPPAPSPVPYI